jgi:hypothetical protein
MVFSPRPRNIGEIHFLPAIILVPDPDQESTSDAGTPLEQSRLTIIEAARRPAGSPLHPPPGEALAHISWKGAPKNVPIGTENRMEEDLVTPRPLPGQQPGERPESIGNRVANGG